MKAAEYKRDIQRGGNFVESAFQIMATGKAFKILSSGLYSDKILAIIRELSCNAKDAHKLAGKEQLPFDLHLPNELEPYFSVRDYGVGLSDVEIQGEESAVLDERGHPMLDENNNPIMKRKGGLYQTYFMSTKSDSNDFIGTLGLGSKSPFSYSESFTIISIYDGIKRTYTAYIREDGNPSVALMTTEQTDECNGVEVSMPVKRDDFYSFQSSARKALRYFDLKPNITGVHNFQFDEPEYILEGQGWKIRKNNDGNVLALMGNVAYPVDESALPDMTDDQKAIFSSPFLINFEIGDLDVAASREHLSYDVMTIANIKKKLSEIVDSFCTEVQKDFAKSKTLWEARIKYHDLYETGGSGYYYTYRQLLKTGNLILKHKTTVISESAIEIDSRKVPHFSYERYYHQASKIKKSTEGIRSEVDRTNDKISTVKFWTIPAMTSVNVIISDVKTGKQKRLKQLMLDKYDKKYAYVFSIDPLYLKDKEYVNKQIKKLIRLIGSPKYFRLSEVQLPKVDRNPVRSSHVHQRVKTDGYVWTGEKVKHYGWRRIPVTSGERCWATVQDINRDIGGIYVPLSRFQVVDNRVHGSTNEKFHKIVDKAEKLGILDTGSKVYGFRPKELKIIEETSEWKNFFDVLQEYLETELKNNAIQKCRDYVEYSEIKKKTASYILPGLFKDCLERAGVSDKSTSMIFATRLAELEKESALKYSDIYYLFNVLMYGKVDIYQAQGTGLLDMWKEIDKTYPMITAGSHYSADMTFQKHVAEYIKIVDDSKGE